MGETDSDALTPSEAWAEFADQLRVAGEGIGAQLDELDDIERADGYRALLRALNNQLGRFEVDRERPELVPFNGWREKFLMDNPDFRYWVADVRDDRRYRIVGSMAGAVYMSITAYASSGLIGASASARIDSDALALADDGTFEVIVSRDRPLDGETWLELPEGARSVWLRMFHDAVVDDDGWCRIEALDDEAPPPPIDPAQFTKHLRRAGRAVAQWPRIVQASVTADQVAPNELRHWAEMTGGAAFTEPGIHYLRGSWELDDGEALVIEGDAVPCRYWSILLYSRFLNSLDHRHRRVSRTGAATALVDGRYRYVLSASDPGGDWLDTEGRRFGIVVMRFLHPEQPPTLPTTRRVPLADLGLHR